MFEMFLLRQPNEERSQLASNRRVLAVRSSSADPSWSLVPILVEEISRTEDTLEVLRGAV